ncbi:MAG: TIGR02710 family CRISPR-associated CARF protein [Dehalococcoidia bacterium]
MNALMISVGTGVGPDGNESIIRGLRYSITRHNPDKIFFVVSEESRKATLPGLAEGLGKPYEEIVLPDSDDVNAIYGQLLPRYKYIRKHFDYIVIDYTSGTKAMSAALAILGSLHEADSLSYVTGRRRSGVVVTGTEKLLTLQPYTVFIEKRFAEAVNLFNKCQFDAALHIISQIKQAVPDPLLLDSLLPFKNVALAYSAWDRFDHQQALEQLKEVKLAEFDKNKAFLGKLCHGEEKEPYHIADLINNATRRGDVEGKYDDAVARLYRTIELIAQFRLKHYGIPNTSDVPKDRIPQSLASQFQAVLGKVQIALDMDYQFLAAYDDELGKRFLADHELRDFLSKRNKSILAHGLKPIEKSDYEQLSRKVLDFARVAVTDLDHLLGESSFENWQH